MLDIFIRVGLGWSEIGEKGARFHDFMLNHVLPIPSVFSRALLSIFVLPLHYIHIMSFATIMVV